MQQRRTVCDLCGPSFGERTLGRLRARRVVAMAQRRRAPWPPLRNAREADVRCCSAVCAGLRYGARAAVGGRWPATPTEVYTSVSLVLPRARYKGTDASAPAAARGLTEPGRTVEPVSTGARNGSRARNAPRWALPTAPTSPSPSATATSASGIYSAACARKRKHVVSAAQDGGLRSKADARVRQVPAR